MILTVALPIPAAPGFGAYVDVTALGPHRSLMVWSDRTDQVELEASGDGNPNRGIRVHTVKGSDHEFLHLAAPFVRIRRTEGNGGNFFAFLSADPAGKGGGQGFASPRGPDAAAGDEWGADVCYRSNGRTVLRDVVLYFWGNVVGDPANFARVTVGVIDAAGAPVGVLGTFSTTANVTALVPVPVPLDPAFTELQDGWAVIWQIEKNDAGVQLDGVSICGRLQ